MFVMRPDAFDDLFWSLHSWKGTIHTALVYDATMRFMNSNMNKIEYPIVVPVVS
ncbi:hypothetical protein HYE05_03225 [Mycoplasmopsis bovis]|nr:hypothetical protein [Mycoplasmopsis bovis]QQH27459.1 hypothetical protein HYE05_03225 [Mycoplasmopsis bovis]